MRKQGGFTDLFLFIIIAFILILALGVFIYVGNTTVTSLHDVMDTQSTSEVNYTEIVNESVGQVPVSYDILRWGSMILILAMMMSIFYGSYKVTTKPIFFVPYIVVVIVAIILSVVVANVYDELLTDSQLATTLAQFTASNFILLYLPYIISVIGIVGGIIMFTSYSLLKQQELSFLG